MTAFIADYIPIVNNKYYIKIYSINNIINDIYHVKVVDDLYIKPVTPTMVTSKILPMDIRAYTPDTKGNGLLAGGTHINTTEHMFETDVILYSNDIVVSKQRTVDGKFNFPFLNDNLNYDIKAVPTNKDFQPRIVTDLKPVIDKGSYKFLYYCYYDGVYQKGTEYKIRTVAYDTKGVLRYNLDNATTGIDIHESTGVITINVNINGVYEFTANCSDLELGLTRVIPMRVEIIDYKHRVYLDGSSFIDSTGYPWTSHNTKITSNGFKISNGYLIRDTGAYDLYKQDFDVTVEFIVDGFLSSGVYIYSNYKSSSPNSAGFLIYVRDTGVLVLDYKDVIESIYTREILPNIVVDIGKTYIVRLTRRGTNFTLSLNDTIHEFATAKVIDFNIADGEMNIGTFHSKLNNQFNEMGNITIKNFELQIKH